MASARKIADRIAMLYKGKIIWAGPVGNWIAACDRILGWDVETIVPGHGPITDKSGVRAMRDYLTTLRDAAKARYEAGLDWHSAASEIIETIPGAERIVYDELGHEVFNEPVGLDIVDTCVGWLEGALDL